MSRSNRREFLCRSVQGGLAISAAGSFTSLGSRLLADEAKADTSKPLKVCLVSGSLEYKSDESLEGFQKHLERDKRVVCSRAFRREDDDLPGLEALDDTDVMLLFTRRLTIDGEQLARIKRYCDAGRPVVGVRTASHAFQNWLELDREVLGGNYKGHYGNELKTQVELIESVKDDALLKGFAPFVSDGSLYRNSGIADDCHVLLNGSIPEHREPVAWHRQHNGGRVFYTSLGHPHDFSNDSFVQLLERAVHWAGGREI